MTLNSNFRLLICIYLVCTYDLNLFCNFCRQFRNNRLGLIFKFIKLIVEGGHYIFADRTCCGVELLKASMLSSSLLVRGKVRWKELSIKSCSSSNVDWSQFEVTDITGSNLAISLEQSVSLKSDNHANLCHTSPRYCFVL